MPRWMGFAAAAMLCAPVVDASARAPQTPMSATLGFGEEAEAPEGFAAMCRVTPAHCAAEAMASAAAPAFDPEELRRVNLQVNHRVRQVSDALAFGVEELWRPSGVGAGAIGDCEDLALEKQGRLRAIGYPPSSTLLAVVYRRDMGLHVVLLVRADAGDFVLDSRSGRVRPWSAAGYTWLRVQSPSDPMRWHRVDTQAPVMTLASAATATVASGS